VKMAAWRECLLGDVVNLKRGYDLPHSSRSVGPFPVVSSSGITDYHVEAKVRAPGVVTGRYGTLGQVFFIEQDFWPLNTSLYVQDFKGNDPRFIAYFLGTLSFGSQNAAGAVPGVNRNHLHAMVVCLPPLPIQRRIASILSAYDDLIENSQRRIKILEVMARALYREWFVHFRFPGHENHPRVASPLGEIPEGWQVKKLFELTKVNYGKNLPTKKLADDGLYPVYGAAKIIGRYTEYTREQRTIICGCRGSVGEMQITQPQCYVTNNSFTFDPTHPDNYFWLFHTLRERGLRDVVGGAAQPQITLEGISSVELVTPPLSFRNSFQQAVSALFERMWTLDSQIQNLRRTRDRLLPRLLSGQIALDELETA